MKKIMTIIGLILTISAASAQAAPVNGRIKLEGIVHFTRTFTMTCMAIGCPPSLPYYYVQLNKVRGVDQDVDFTSLEVEQIATKPGVDALPTQISFQNVNLQEGDEVLVDVKLEHLNNANYNIVQEVYSVTKL